MSKYIIKNCPSQLTELCLYGVCEYCNDCVLKQIVELCKDVENPENVKTLYDAAQSGIFLQANKILKLLDIKECE